MARPNGDAYEFVDCKTIGHSWYSIEANKNPKGPGWYMMVRCERCGTERADIVSRYGALESRSYRYPEGFKRAKGEGLSKVEWRVQFLARLR